MFSQQSITGAHVSLAAINPTLTLKLPSPLLMFQYFTVSSKVNIKVFRHTLSKCAAWPVFNMLHRPAGQMVYTVRQRCGRQLAIEAPTNADVVSTVPESATPAALGYAQQVSLLQPSRFNTATFSHTPDLTDSPISALLTVWAAVH